MSTGPDTTQDDLAAQLQRAGFYPHLIADVLREELDGAQPLQHLLHLETHVERGEVHRHATILVLTGSALAVLHVDDHQFAETSEPVANVSVETIALSRIDSVVVSAVYPRPHEHRAGQGPMELTLGIAWSGGARLDLGPAACEDPQCEADHGYTGSSVNEDLVLRVSAAADGEEALKAARRFARELRRATTESATFGAPQQAGAHAPAPQPGGPRSTRLGRGAHR